MLAQDIEKKLNEQFRPEIVELINESHLHSSHFDSQSSSNIGSKIGLQKPRAESQADSQVSETHFKLVMVSAKFEGLNRLARHRLVLSTLNEELSQVHAFSMKLSTPSEWKELQST